MRTIINEKELLIAHHQVLVGTFFKELHNTSAYLKVSTNVPGSLEWDYLMPFEEFNLDFPRLYLDKHITSHKCEFTDSWLICPLTKNQPNARFTHTTVTNAEQMKLFLQHFLLAYSSVTPNDPYGTLPRSYYDSLLNAYIDNTTQLQFLMTMNQDAEIVGVSALGIQPPYAFSYCVGITPQFRRQGFSSYILDYHKYLAMHQQCDYLIVQTAHQSFVESLYFKQGFSLWKTMNYYSIT